MSQIQDLLLPLKQQVNAVEFDADDQLLGRNLKRSLQQLLGMCNRSLSEILDIASDMEEDELEGGMPADFSGAVLELAAAMYRYGEAYADTSFRFTPSFEMVVSKYRKTYNPFPEEDEEP